MKFAQAWGLFIATVNLFLGKVYAIDKEDIFVPAIIACIFHLALSCQLLTWWQVRIFSLQKTCFVYMLAGKNIFIAEDIFCILKIIL